MLEQVLQHLAASGPTALILGVAVWKLWDAGVKERDRHQEQEDSEREHHARQENDMRAAHEAEREAERTRHMEEEEKSRSALLELYAKLYRAVRKDPSHDGS